MAKKSRSSRVVYEARHQLDPERILGVRAAPPWLMADVRRWPGESVQSFWQRVAACSQATRLAEVRLELILSPPD